MKLVIDASFIASLLLPDEAADQYATQLRQIKEGGAVAPALWQFEVVNMLLTAERRKRIDSSQFTRMVEAIDSLPVTLQPALTPKQRGDLLHLARKHRLTAYDAAYLELALRLDLPLATLDRHVITAAKDEGAKLAV
jgi:predicted nucleic acid-binding protein